MHYFHSVPDEELSGPVFLEIPRSQNVDEGAPVSFTCRLDNVDTGTTLEMTISDGDLFKLERNKFYFSFCYFFYSGNVIA